MWDPSFIWDHWKASKTMSRRFLKHLDDDLMVLRELAGKDALLDSMLANKRIS